MRLRATQQNSTEWWQIQLLLSDGKTVIVSHTHDEICNPTDLKIEAAFRKEEDARAYCDSLRWEPGDRHIRVLIPGVEYPSIPESSGYRIRDDLPTESRPIAYRHPDRPGPCYVPPGTEISRVLNVNDDVWDCQVLMHGATWFATIPKEAIVPVNPPKIEKVSTDTL